MLPNYFHEIGKVPLLTAEEEVELSRRVQRGCEEARNRMIAANLRLVVKIAAEFNSLGLPVGDLISEGNLGLIHAVGKFSPTKGARFSTYASWWIRHAMHRSLGDQTYAMRLTSLARAKLSKLRRAAHGITLRLGREPTDDELADELGMETAAVEHLKNVAARPASMEAVFEESGMTFGSLLADENADNPHEVLGGKDHGVEATELLAILPPREREVIVWRFGLEGHHPMTLEEISRRLGRTRERVRQIQEQALKRLRRAFARRKALTFVPTALAPTTPRITTAPRTPTLPPSRQAA
jgi:RNA polymerase primary sigma factor